MSNLFINQSLLSTLCVELLSDLREIISDTSEGSVLPSDGVQKLQAQSSIASSAKMRSVKRFYQLLIEVFKKYDGVSVPSNELDIIKKSLRYLANHLDEIVHSQKNTPIALTKVYTQLESLVNRNSSNTIAGELFLPCTPDWSQLPDRDTAISESEFKDAIKQHLNTYVDACVKFTKDGGSVENAVALRQVLVTLEPKIPFKSYWLVFDSAIAIFDRVIKTNQIDTTSKWVAARLKSELDGILNGNTSPDESNLSMLLFFVAKYPSDSSARIKKLKENYQLANFLADPSGVDPENIAKFLQVLARLHEVWELTVKQDKLDNISKFVVDLNKNASFVKNQGFSILIESLKLSLDEYPKYQGNASIKKDFELKGATALLSLEKQLKEGSAIEQATILSNDLRKLFNLPLLEVTVSGDEQARARAGILKDLADQSLSDLSDLESELQAFLSGNHDKKNDIVAVIQMQRQIFNSVIGKDNSISLAFAKFAEILEPVEDEKEQFVIVGNLTSLSQMVEMLKSSEKSALENAKKWLSNFVQTVKEDERSLIDSPKEEDLIEIFLEESKDIVVSLRQNLKLLKSDYYDVEQLKQIHRSFHTLKGSGRMIGLRHFGDVMFAVEDLLKRWNRINKPANDALFQLLSEALVMVDKSVLQLEKEQRIVVSAENILSNVQILEAEADTLASPVKVEDTRVEISLIRDSIVHEPVIEPIIDVVDDDLSMNIVEDIDVKPEPVKSTISLVEDVKVEVKPEPVKPTISLVEEVKVEVKPEPVKPTISLVEEVKVEIKPEPVRPTISLVEEVKVEVKPEPVKPAISLVEEVKVEVKPEPVKPALPPVNETKTVKTDVAKEQSVKVEPPKQEVPDTWSTPPKKEGFFTRLFKALFGKK